MKASLSEEELSFSISTEEEVEEDIASQEEPALASHSLAPQQKIRIKLKSYWLDLLQLAVDKILAVARETGATVSGPVPLPRR
jgi:Ribosomal protein S10p/S20e